MTRKQLSIRLSASRQSAFLGLRRLGGLASDSTLMDSSCDIVADPVNSEDIWQYLAPTIGRAGFHLSFSYTKPRYGSRRSALWPPAANPFKPLPFESFVGYNVCYPPFSLAFEEARVSERVMFCLFSIFHSLNYVLQYPNIRTGHDAAERSVHLKLVPLYENLTQTEVEIMTFLNSDDLRDDPQNHTMPLLAHLKCHDWDILVTPTWYTRFDGYHFLAHIHELLDMGKQLLEVAILLLCTKRMNLIFEYIRVSRLCISTI